MKFKDKIIILSVIIGVLLVAYILGNVFSPANLARGEAQRPLFPGFNKDLVQYISIEDNDGKVQLKKMENEWMIVKNDNFFPAAVTKIDALLDDLTNVKRRRVVSNNLEQWNNFVDSEKGERHMVLQDQTDKTLIDLYLGKEQADTSGLFMKTSGAQEIVESDISLDIVTTIKFWAYLRVLPESLKSEDIHSISIKTDPEFFNSIVYKDNQEETQKATIFDYRLVKETTEEGENWTLVNIPDLEIATTKVNSLTSTLTNLQAEDFVTDLNTNTGLNNPQLSVTFQTVDNKTYNLIVGKKVPDQDQYYLKFPDKNYIYICSEWRIKNMLKDPLSLKVDKDEAIE
jgi:hypothetical protein